MRRLILVLVLLVALACSAMANVADWKVSTVHGAYQFNIENGGDQLRFLPQLRNDSGWYWFNNNGSTAGDLAIGGLGPNGFRDGSKTFAMTNVAYGMPLNTVKLSFAYYMPIGTTAVYPNPNFFITDGRGTFGIFVPDAAGSHATEVRDGDWMIRSLDLTAKTDESTGFAIYEHNGITAEYAEPFTVMNWADIKNFRIAGFFDYQRSPASGWNSWSNSFNNVSTSWNTFVIRKATTSGNSPLINNVVSGGVPAKEFVISEAGMKAGWGTKALDGYKVRDIAGYINRLDTILTAPYAPYFNIWITDGNGKFAVIANEPSNPEWLNTPGLSKNFDWNDLKTKTVKVFEATDKTWIPNQGANLTFNDLADYTILAPTPAQLGSNWAGLGGGAPREFGTNKAYGFNWIFGDTLSNYVSGNPGYVLANPAVIKGGVTANNEYGITLNWGDTVGPYSRETLIKDLKVTAGGVEYNTATFQADQLAPNLLALDATAESLYVQSDENILVDMNVSGLTQPVYGCQALLGYNNNMLIAGLNPISAGSSIWDDVIYQFTSIPGEINTAIGIEASLESPSAGTIADATVAKITLKAGPTEGETYIEFLPNVDDNKGTYFGAMNGDEPYFVYPTKLNSQTIVIDNTAPTGSVDINSSAVYTKTADVTLALSATDLNGVDKMIISNDLTWNESEEPYAATKDWTLSAGDGEKTVYVKFIDKAGNEVVVSDTITLDTTAPDVTISALTGIIESGKYLQGNVTFSVSANDITSGVKATSVTIDNVVYIPVDGIYTFTINANTANGAHEISVISEDNAGNVSTAVTQTFEVNKNQISGNVSMSFIGNGTRVVTFVLKGANPIAFSIEKTANVDKNGAYTLTNIPDGVTSVSAKTAWTLRKKLSGLSATNGQITANFTLLGGDLNNTNSINILDYSLLKTKYFTTDPSADIDGNGQVNALDYSIMKTNWFMTGDDK